MNNKSELTIEEVREQYESMYHNTSIYGKIELKAWLYHSESRNRNGNPPFSYENYTHHMTPYAYIEQIKLNMLDCEDIGGKEEAMAVLHSYL